ncbi:hypothetical protein FRC02_011399 [Tulasnella sp. 418]|nr:hypothetical protein FRC02_011399 [Tulasnella sp. 418]
MPMSSTKLSTDRRPPLSESLRTETLSDQDFAKTVHRLHALRNQLSAKPKGIKLAEKVYIITGVGSLKGIGRASAFAFAHEGSKHLYLLDLVEENLDELKTTMNRLYPETKVTTSQGDAADGQTVAKLCKQAIDEEGRLDGFFANAGIGEKQFFMDISSKEFMEVMRINLLS